MRCLGFKCCDVDMLSVGILYGLLYRFKLRVFMHASGLKSGFPGVHKPYDWGSGFRALSSFFKGSFLGP